MKTWTLYPYLLVCVLFIVGCAREKTDEKPENEASVAAAVADPPSVASATENREDEAIRIVFLGNSLSAGYGLDPSLAFPALIQEKIDEEGWNATVMNAGVSGETTAGGLRRIDWLLRERIDILVLELGGNDGLRGISPEVTKQNLQAIIDQTKDRYPDARVVIAGMQVPPNLGFAFTTRFRELYGELAEENDAALIPFLLEGVGGIRRLNLPDGIHPTAEGHRIVAETVWQTLRPVVVAVLQDT